MFRQEGVIGFFRGKFKVTLFCRTQSNLVLMGTAHSWTPPLSGYLVMTPVRYKFKLKTA